MPVTRPRVRGCAVLQMMATVGHAAIGRRVDGRCEIPLFFPSLIQRYILFCSDTLGHSLYQLDTVAIPDVGALGNVYRSSPQRFMLGGAGEGKLTSHKLFLRPLSPLSLAVVDVLYFFQRPQ